MDLLSTYTSDDEDDVDAMKTASAFSSSNVSTYPLTIAPVVVKGSTTSMNSKALTLGHFQNNLMSNPTIDVVLAPVQGPSHPFKARSHGSEISRPGVGATEATNVEDWAFDKQYQSFQRSGFAVDCSSNEVLGDYHEFTLENASQATRSVRRKDTTKTKRQRLSIPENIGDDDQSPWAPEPECTELSIEVGSKVEETIVISSVDDSPVLEQENVYIVEPDEEAEKWEKVDEKKMSFTLPPRPQRGSTINEATSIFHGKELVDYQGRSWVTPPAGVRAETEEHECFIPKKCIKKYTGHTKGVNVVEFFPKTGHLLLSASMDGKCKIWDVYGDRNVKRTFSGHSEAVRMATFNESGMEFLSSSFDRSVRLWDVETGQAKGTFTNRKMGYDVKFRPTDNNIFMMAASDNKIYQWDVRTGEVCQEYNYHLQPCNTVTFFDQGRKFVSTSDDKKILVWEFDIPVPIKYIQESNMHCIPSVTTHPSGEHFAGQSMNNTIVVYTCGDKVKETKKKFVGHNNSGYACHIGFSPNGKFIISGDGLGKMHVWDWKSSKVFFHFFNIILQWIN